MNRKATLDQHRELKLNGMASAYEAAIKLPVQDQLSKEQFIGCLVEAEKQYRITHKTNLYLRQSKFRYNAVLEQVYCDPERNLTSDQPLTLAEGRFIDHAQNILIAGKPVRKIIPGMCSWKTCLLLWPQGPVLWYEPVPGTGCPDQT